MRCGDTAFGFTILELLGLLKLPNFLFVICSGGRPDNLPWFHHSNLSARDQRGRWVSDELIRLSDVAGNLYLRAQVADESDGPN
jgi:hypothetical protein